MEWPESLADDLPKRREDEPANLRDDIVDELADHLHCAMAKERRGTADEAAARERVLERFGDPVRVARQLWFDSMKGRLMRQRLAIFGCVLLTSLSLAGVAVLWQRSQADQQVNRAMFEQLAALVKQQNTETRSLEWNPFKVRCVLDTPGGKPAEGIQVTASGHFLSGGDNVNVTKTTDVNGLADFGLVRPCQAHLDLVTSWNEQMRQSVTISPGLDHVETVVCPAGPPAEVKCEYEFDLPEDLRGQGLALVAGFHSRARDVDGQWWGRYSAGGDQTDFAQVISESSPVPKYADISSRGQEIRLLSKPTGSSTPLDRGPYLLSRTDEHGFRPYSTNRPATLNVLGVVQLEDRKQFKVQSQSEPQSGWLFLAVVGKSNAQDHPIEPVAGAPNRWRITPDERLWVETRRALHRPQVKKPPAKSEEAAPAAAAPSSDSQGPSQPTTPGEP